MMIGNDQKRRLPNSQLPELSQDLLTPDLRQGRNVMQRDDQTFHERGEFFPKKP